MIRLIAEAWLAIQSSWKLLTFKPGWESGFDISVGGFWRSFTASLFALPMVAFMLVSSNQLGNPMPDGYRYLAYFATWMAFPLAAFAAARVVGAPRRFVHWVVVHNWAILLLYAIQAFAWALRTAGLIDTAMLGMFFIFYEYFRVLVHWRIAYCVLGVPTITSALAAAVPILLSEITVQLVLGLYDVPAPAG